MNESRFKLLIYYIHNSAQGGIIEPGAILAGRSALGVVRKLCQKHLFTYEGYIKSVQEILWIKRKVPVVISQQLVLFSIKAIEDYDNIWINFNTIKKTIFEGNSLILIFDDQYQLSIKLREIAYRRYQDKIIKIINYKNSLV